MEFDSSAKDFELLTTNVSIFNLYISKRNRDYDFTAILSSICSQKSLRLPSANDRYIREKSLTTAIPSLGAPATSQPYYLVFCKI